MRVRVCDMIMGAGKTESAITMMNEDVDSRYIFITPYLKEVERIKTSCHGRRFQDPKNLGEGKLTDLHRLLRAGENIASTHALFRSYNDETTELIRDGGYKLILDEVFEVVEIVSVSKKDLAMLIGESMIQVEEDGHVRWLAEEYEGRFEDLRDMCRGGNITLYNNHLMLWTFPVDVFQAFRSVTILTYMFDAQVQKYYFDMCGVEIERIWTVKTESGQYRFCNDPVIPGYVPLLPDRVHILDDEKLNAIGDDYGALSSSWFERAYKSREKLLLRQLKNNISNVFKHIFKSSGCKNLWTSFKDYYEYLKGRGYTKGFLSFNVRATNAYRDRDHLVYCVNVFYNPLLKNYFLDHGVSVQEDEYALSEMVQWIWRSAIRDGEEIWIYIPSRRMRELLVDWLGTLKNGL